MTLEAYCVKCKTKREIENPQPVYTSRGTPGTKGTCPVCGTALFRMGVTDAHANLPKPEIVAAPSGKAKSAKKTTKAKTSAKAKAKSKTSVASKTALTAASTVKASAKAKAALAKSET